MDYDRLEEDWVNALLTPPPSQRGISVEGARILAGATAGAHRAAGSAGGRGGGRQSRLPARPARPGTRATPHPAPRTRRPGGGRLAVGKLDHDLGASGRRGNRSRSRHVKRAGGECRMCPTDFGRRTGRPGTPSWRSAPDGLGSAFRSACAPSRSRRAVRPEYLRHPALPQANVGCHLGDKLNSSACLDEVAPRLLVAAPPCRSTVTRTIVRYHESGA